MKRRPYTPREVEKVRIAAREYTEGIRETLLRLIDTIEEKQQKIDELEHEARRARAFSF